MNISSEQLAYWYFRLNGFFGNENFIIHNALGDANHATEVDYIGMRFKHRKELYDIRTGRYMKDDNLSELFKNYKKCKRAIFICLAEVKRGIVSLNCAQISNNDTLQKILWTLGCVKNSDVNKVVSRLRKYGFCNTYSCHISFVAIGGCNENSDNPILSNIPVIVWDEVKKFIYNRFRDYRMEKADLHEWSSRDLLEEIRDLAISHTDFDEFKNNIVVM